MSKQELAERPKQSALSTMASRFHVEPANLLTTLKDTAFKGATDAQMMALCVVANEYGLNPFTKEIYAFPDKKSGGIIPVIGVDGWYRIVNEHPQFNGVEIEIEWAGQTPVSATCRMHRKDRDNPTVLTEYLSECKRNTDPWNSQPVRMLRHRAFIQCARVTFGLAGADPEDVARMEAAPRGAEVSPRSNPFAKPAVVEIVETDAEGFPFVDPPVEVEGGEA
jgi:phage recombination protein Bet